MPTPTPAKADSLQTPTKKRRLRRYCGGASDGLDVTQRPCLTGKRLSEPICLPTQEIDGVTMVRVAAREGWVNQALAGRVVSTDYTTAAQMVKAKIAALIEATEEADSPDAAAGHKLQAASQGRAALGVSDDEDQDEDEGDSGVEILQGEEKAVQRLLGAGKKTRQHAASTVITIQNVQMRVALRNRILWVECGASSLDALLKEIGDTQAAPAERRAKRVADKAARLQDAAGDSSLEGRVSFDTSRSWWVVKYLKADGNRGTWTRGLAVPMLGITGGALPVEEYRERLRKTCAAAKLKWNELDCSGRPRLE
jgi:hypothetical protein